MWYIEYLLLHSFEIRAREDIDSDEYNDLLILEKTIKKFKDEGLLSEREQLLLKFVIDGCISKDLYLGRQALARNFRFLCKRFSLVLGDIFTDEGYLDYMQNKYNLTEEQVKKLEQFMLSKFRYDILNKPYREN